MSHMSRVRAPQGVYLSFPENRKTTGETGTGEREDCEVCIGTVLRCLQEAALRNVFEVSRRDVTHTQNLHCDTERAVPAASRSTAFQANPLSRVSLASTTGSTSVLSAPMALLPSGQGVGLLNRWGLPASPQEDRVKREA